MKLWIRSQDKSKLMKVDTLEIIENVDECVINGTGTNYDFDLGKYKTKERALEVLDEIHNIIKPRIITTSYECEIEKNPEDKLSFNVEMDPKKTEIIEMSTFVYEMPKE